MGQFLHALFAAFRRAALVAHGPRPCFDHTDRLFVNEQHVVCRATCGDQLTNSHTDAAYSADRYVDGMQRSMDENC
jgi:hypothetical protein